MRTAFNILIFMCLLIVQTHVFGKNLHRSFKKEAKAIVANNESRTCDSIGYKETSHLPDIVQKYIFRTEFYGKEKVRNMKVTFEGKIRGNPTDKWMKIKAYQVSSFNDQTRLFYIRAWKMGIPAFGFHCFKNGKASMKVKLLGLLTIVDTEGDLMNQSETVTHFNDMCLMAPGTLIDKNIAWEELDPLTVKAIYTCEGKSISAILYFNIDGYLENFISNDRYDLSKPLAPKRYPFSTPINSYAEWSTNHGVVLADEAKTVYHRPEGEFVYGVFRVKKSEYNINK
jgi:hypothetical protein